MTQLKKSSISFKTITAPHINVNDLEMVVSEWFTKPWQAVSRGDNVCEVVTTKATVTVETEFSGYIYPVVNVGQTVKVGEPLAHIFPEHDIAQLEQLNLNDGTKTNATVTKKAQEMMDEHGLTVSDFQKFSTISSDTVVAKIRELKVETKPSDKGRIQSVLSKITIDHKSVALWGEHNQVLLALDAFKEDKNSFRPVAVIDVNINDDHVHGVPVLTHEFLNELKNMGLRNVYICGQNIQNKKEQIKLCEELGLNIVSALHPTASISTLARLGKGVFVGAKAAIGPDVEIGNFSQVLSGATVAHHSKIGSFVNISDGAHLGGNVTVGDHTLIGIGVNINKRINIGRNVTIVSGATVLDHLSDATIFRLNSDVKTIEKNNI